MYTIGVDLGGTNIDVGVVDENRSIIAQAHTPTLARRASAEVLDDIARCARAAVQEAGIGLDAVSALGIGSPGTCDAESGVVLNAHNLGWFGVPVRAELERRLGLHIYLGNDADCAALGETVAGAARGCSDVLMVTLGTGIGGGIVAGGRVYAGHRNLRGEIGHMCIAMDGEECTC
ncbi:MAG: ROK family protein, partial [Butyricicoccus sp.]|nr:ROK family protein [Butyricicoccus sp.]